MPVPYHTTSKGKLEQWVRSLSPGQSITINAAIAELDRLGYLGYSRSSVSATFTEFRANGLLTKICKNSWIKRPKIVGPRKCSEIMDEFKGLNQLVDKTSELESSLKELKEEIKAVKAAKKGEKFYIGAITEYFGSYEVTNLFLYAAKEKDVFKVEHEIAKQWRQGVWDEDANEFKFGDHHHTPVDGREILFEEDFKVLEKYVTTIYKGGKHV